MEWAILTYESGDKPHILYFQPDVLRGAIQEIHSDDKSMNLVRVPGYYQMPDTWEDVTHHVDEMIEFELSEPENIYSVVSESRIRYFKSVRLYKVNPHCGIGDPFMIRILYDKEFYKLPPLIYDDHIRTMVIIIRNNPPKKYYKNHAFRHVVDDLKKISKECIGPVITACNIDPFTIMGTVNGGASAGDMSQDFESMGCAENTFDDELDDVKDDMMNKEIKPEEFGWYKIRTKKDGKYMTVYIDTTRLETISHMKCGIKVFNTGGYKEIPVDIDSAMADYRVLIYFDEDGDVDDIKIQDVEEMYTLDDFVAVIYNDVVDAKTGETEFRSGYVLKEELDEIFMSELTDDELNNQTIDVYNIDTHIDTSVPFPMDAAVPTLLPISIHELDISNDYFLEGVYNLFKERTDD